MRKRIFLRAFEYSDLTFINELRNDDTLYELTCGNKYHISSERDKKWIEDKIFNNYHQLYLVVCSNEDKKPIGYLSASNIDYINRKFTEKAVPRPSSLSTSIMPSCASMIVFAKGSPRPIPCVSFEKRLR